MVPDVLKRLSFGLELVTCRIVGTVVEIDLREPRRRVTIATVRHEKGLFVDMRHRRQGWSLEIEEDLRRIVSTRDPELGSLSTW